MVISRLGKYWLLKLLDVAPSTSWTSSPGAAISALGTFRPGSQNGTPSNAKAPRASANASQGTLAVPLATYIDTLRR